MQRNLLIFLTVTFLMGSLAQAQKAEPAYCQPANFKNSEIMQQPVNNLQNAHIYKLGNTTVVGLAIGDTNASDTAKLAQHYSSVGATEKYCTWYVNEGNTEAEQAFVHEYLDKPGDDAVKYSQEYITKMAPHIDQNPINFVSCIEKRGYIAIGCNGMKHRGPSVFGMLLGYSGCSPANANAIVNQVWGLNGVKENVRVAIIQKAYDLGVAHPELSQRLSNQFLGRPH
jgi:hypothetical protein